MASGGKEALLSSLGGDGGGEERRRAETRKARDATVDPLEEIFNVPSRDVTGKTGLVTLKSANRGNTRRSIVPRAAEELTLHVINDENTAY